MEYVTHYDDDKEHQIKQYTKKDFDINDDWSQHTSIAYVLNGKKDNGYYVEIGAGHYKDGNHSYPLETEHGWKGVSIDTSQHLVDQFNANRKNPCILANALTFHWDAYFKENDFPEEIDFLTIDIDFEPSKYNNLLALINLPILRKKFKFIAIEHAAHVFYQNEELRKAQRIVLSALGYHLMYRGHTDDIWTIEKISTMNGFDQIPHIDFENI